MVGAAGLEPCDPLIKSQLLWNLSYAPAVTPSRRALSEARQYAMGGASSATSELSCSNASDTAPLPRAFTGLMQRTRPTTSCGVLRSRLRSKESLSRHTFRSTSLARQALLSMSTAPSGSPPAWLRAPGLWWCKHREGTDFSGKGSIAVHVDGLLLVAAPPGSERRACGGASIAMRDADPENEDDGQQANP